MKIPAAIRSRFSFAGDLARAAEVARILAKYGLAAWFSEFEWAPLRQAIKSHGGEVLVSLPFEARVRLALTDSGTTFIKLGQMLSTRPHLVGDALASELGKLRESTPPNPPDVAIKMVETELGRPIDECFMHFDGVAVASASIGQVHKARLKSGRRAAVKVQHPGIEGTIRRDLEILAFLAEIAEKNQHLRRYQPVELVREFSRTMLGELDFRRESRNLQTFRRNFADDPTVVFPKPYAELTTSRVLTMSFIAGVSIRDTGRLDKLKVDRQELARQGANIFVQMMFRDGFYHADPHAGNLRVLPGGKIGLLDAGMVGRIDETMQRQVEDILLAAGERDAGRLTDAVTRICGTPRDLDRAALSTNLMEFFEEYGTQDLSQFNVSGALRGISNILHNHGLILPGKLSLLIRCLIELEGTGRSLSPAFNLAELLGPWRDTILWQRYSPKARLKKLAHLYGDWEDLAQSVPKVARNMLDRMDQGRFAIRIEHQHLKSGVNRLVVGLFISSLLIASAILIARGVPPTIRGQSLFGIVGYAVAVVFGFRMLWVNRDKLVSDRDGDWE